MPSPLDVEAIKGTSKDGSEQMTRESSDDAPFAALAFKIMTDPFVGTLTFTRIYSGVLEKGTPVIKVSVEPKTKADQDKMTNALIKLAAEDPSFRFTRDEESGQTVIEGMGELHLEIICDRMMREFKVECQIGPPQVAYREAITKEATVEYTHKKQSGGSGQFAKVVVKFAPLDENDEADGTTGFIFNQEIKGGSVPKEYIPGVAK